MMIVNNMFATKIILLTDRMAKISGLLRWSKSKTSMSDRDRHQLAMDYATVDDIDTISPYDDPLY